MDATGIAQAIAQLAAERGERHRLSTGIVTDVTDGLTSVRRIGNSVPEEELRRIDSRLPAIDERVVLADVGGAPVVVGVLVDGTEPAPLPIGQTYHTGDSASAATTPTNTSNAVWETVRSYTWSWLPDGEYDLVIDWSAMFSDSESGSVNVRLVVGGVDDTTFTLSMTTAREPIRHVRRLTGVAIAGGITIAAQYKRNAGSGTASARNPSFDLSATRVG